MISDLTELVDQPGPIRLEIRSGQGVLVLDFDNERNRIYDFLIRKFIQRVEGKTLSWQSPEGKTDITRLHVYPYDLDFHRLHLEDLQIRELTISAPFIPGRMDIYSIVLPENLVLLRLKTVDPNYIYRLDLPSQLETLILTDCQLKNLAGLTFPSSLKTLNLSRNRLHQMKHLNQICFPPNLQSLKMRANGLKTLDLTLPRTLKVLDVRDNPFSQPDNLKSKLARSNPNLTVRLT